MSPGRISIVSSVSRICNPANLVLGVTVQGISVVFAILMATRLSLAVVITGATVSFARWSNCGRGCTVPVIGWSLLTDVDVCMMRVDCAGMVRLLSVSMVIGFGLHLCNSSVSANVIYVLEKSIVPCAVSNIAECFRRKANPIIGMVVRVMRINVSLKVYYSILNLIIYVPRGCSSSALAYWTLKGGCGALLMMH